MNYVSQSPGQTKKIAAALVKKVIKAGLGKAALVIALEGELGTGKTTFIKGLAKALGIKQKISSPTFILLKIYKLKTKRFSHLVHLDAYRLKNYKDLRPLGFEELATEPKNIILIEWADRVKNILPLPRITIRIDHFGNKDKKRTIQINDQRLRN